MSDHKSALCNAFYNPTRPCPQVQYGVARQDESLWHSDASQSERLGVRSISCGR